ncbi:MAG: pilus assembly protein [Polaromonas sp.]|nr:pilus assembly protein [Polaromonas sp.]
MTRKQSGASAVEFALVLPFLVIILFLTMDFGFMVYNKAIITNASREAARYGTVVTATPWSIDSVAMVACRYTYTDTDKKNNNKFTSLLISTNTGSHNKNCNGTADPIITVSNDNGNVPPKFGDRITVSINYPYSGFILNKINAWMSNTAFPSLTAVSSMNHE